MKLLNNSIDTETGSIERIATTGLKAPPRMQRAYTRADIRRFARFVEQYGIRLPILVDANGVVCAGLIWFLAAQYLEIPDLPVVRVTRLSEQQLVVYRIAEQKLQELSPWDDSVLGIEFKTLLTNSPEIDLDITGFSTSEIDLCISTLSSREQKAEAAILPTWDKDSICKPGDVWQLDHHRILCASALDQTSWHLVLGKRVADAVITDPPYNVKIDGHVSGKGVVKHDEFVMASGELSQEQFQAFLSTVLKHMKLHSRDGSLHYVFMDWRHLNELLNAGGSCFEKLVNLCVWVKPNGGMGSFYRSRHELAAVFQNGIINHRNNVQLGRHGRNRTNVWEFAGATTLDGRKTDEGNLLALHPTVKPVQMLADMILDCTVPRNIVVDPFLGSGSTLIACERTHRRCFGIELDPRYVDVSVQRWQNHTGLKAVHANGRSFDEIAAGGRL